MFSRIRNLWPHSPKSYLNFPQHWKLWDRYRNRHQCRNTLIQDPGSLKKMLIQPKSSDDFVPIFQSLKAENWGTWGNLNPQEFLTLTKCQPKCETSDWVWVRLMDRIAFWDSTWPAWIVMLDLDRVGGSGQEYPF